jgi:hypothetical protein
VEILITEGQLKRIIAEQTKPAPVKPKNKSYTTTQDRVLTKDALTGGELKIPKGTKFTAHQNGDKKITKATFTASVDRFENGKNKPSTIYYCNGANSGKFWNGSSKSWYYDKTKVLSGFLTKNLCEKSFGDQSYWESKKIDIKGQRTPAQIANFLKNSNTLDDNEPAIELAFSEIKTLERYNLVKKYLGQDPYKFVSQFIDAREKHGSIQSVTTSYSILSKGKTSDQNKNLASSEGCPIVLTATQPGGPNQNLGAINYMKFFKGAVGTPGSDPLLYTDGLTGTYAKVPDFGWNLNPKTYPYPKYYDQNCLSNAKQFQDAESRKQLIDKRNQSTINQKDYLQKRDTETTNVANYQPPVKTFNKPLSLNEEDNKSKDYKVMSDFNQSLSKQKELIPKFCKTPLERQWDAGDGSGKYKMRYISMYNLCKDYGGLWVYGAGGSEYTCGCRDNSNPALTTAMKTDTGTFNAGKEIQKQQGSTNWSNVEARSVLWGAAALASAFIPVVGPFVAAGIGLGGAADLWTSNKKKEAGIAAFFSLLPIVGKIPGVGTITKGLAEELKAAVISNGALSEKQLETLIRLIKYDEQVSEVMSSGFIQQIERKGLSKLQSEFLQTAVKEGEKKVAELSGVPTYGDLKKLIINKSVVDPLYKAKSVAS